MKKALLILGTLLLLAALGIGAAVVYLPWKDIAARRIEAALTEKGFGEPRLVIKDIGLHGAVFESIHLETAGAPLVLKTITTTYQPIALLRKDFSGVGINVGAAALSWKGGELTAKDVKVSPTGDPAAKFNVRIQHVSVDELLQALTGNRVSATGTVSGTLPVTVSADGALSFGKGTLKTDAPGTLSMPPDAIPGENAQVDVVRQILKNFHYNGLSVEIRNNGGNHISALIALQGNNPDMYDGRPVNLNVSLAGDVLDYIRQNVLLITDPQSFINQGHP